MRGIILEDDLHVIYLITPLNGIEPDWVRFNNIFQRLDELHKMVATFVGISQGYLNCLCQGLGKGKNLDLYNTHVRFFNALLLNDIVQMVPLKNISDKYSVNKGALQALQISANSFAGMVNVFCKR